MNGKPTGIGVEVRGGDAAPVLRLGQERRARRFVSVRESQFFNASRLTYQLQQDDDIVLSDYYGALTVFLPDALSLISKTDRGFDSRVYTVHDSLFQSGASAITITPQLGQLIQNAASYTINTNGAAANLVPVKIMGVGAWIVI